MQAIEYFTAGCREGTLLKHKLLYDEPETLDELLITVDKYATVDSSMKAEIRVSATGKVALRLRELRLETLVGGSSRMTRSAKPRSRLPTVGKWQQQKTSSWRDRLRRSDIRAASTTGCRLSPTSRL